MLSTYAANKVLELVTGKTAFSTPTVTLRLSQADPLPDGSGIDEVTGGGYSGVTLSDSDWDDASGGEIDNAENIDFPEATGTWDEAYYVYAVDGSANLLWYGPLDTPITVTTGEVLRFPVGELGGIIGALAV